MNTVPCSHFFLFVCSGVVVWWFFVRVVFVIYQTCFIEREFGFLDGSFAGVFSGERVWTLELLHHDRRVVQGRFLRLLPSLLASFV